MVATPEGGKEATAPPGAAALHGELRRLLDGLREGGARDPFVNAISRTTLELTRRQDRGDLAPEAIAELVQLMTAEAFARRAARLAAYVGETDPDSNAAALRRLITGVARPDPAAAPVPFEAFRRTVETLHFGVVFTAHPTFALPLPLSRILVQFAVGRDAAGAPLTEEARAALMAEVRAADHRPPAGLTLDDEFAWAMEAMGHAEDALARLHALVLDVARGFYPQSWRALVPRLVSLASWVGYDHDGRSDIGWADTLAMRLKEKHGQLTRLAEGCAQLRAARPESAAGPALERAQAILRRAAAQVERQIEAAMARAGSPPERAASFARRLVEGRAEALTDGTALIALFDEAVGACEDEAAAVALAALRAALAAHGLARGQIHFRLNAAQLHNAVRRQVGLDADPNDPSHRRSYINAINALLAEVRPETVNLGSLMGEKASANRMFMMIAELAKHIDARSPVRFLIAETESAFTLLVALYLARRFGVEQLVEISPLFETAEAMEQGDRVIEEALRSPHFRGYVERMGRICVQFGYSDSGRYIGQMAAAYWIERLRLRIAAVLARHGVADVQVVMFNTHGESIGRGGHPVSLADRLRYLAPPVSRAAFEEAGLAVKEESSFQGGDGYLLFLAPEMAFATLCRIVESVLAPDCERTGDPVYHDTDFAAEFFATIRQEFAGIVDDPGYAALLGAFGTNLLDRTGSRPEQREHEIWAGPRELVHPSQLRAIPNNAILHQLGVLANSVTGLGRATAKDPERFRALLGESPRFRRAIAMVGFAASLSDLDVLGAYVDNFDPRIWLNRSGQARDVLRRDELRLIARQLERADTHARLVKTVRRLQADFLLLRDILAETEGAGGRAASALDDDARAELALLHALRIALIQRIYLLASRIPDFTPHRGLTRADLLQRLLHLEIEATIPLFDEIFPRRDASAAASLDFAEPASYAGEAVQTYELEHARLFAPIKAHFALIRRISAAITHHIGAVG